jgi:hypothetical protein
MKHTSMTEAKIQNEVCKYLDDIGSFYTSTANGARMSGREMAKLKRQGLKRGVPDILIFDHNLKYFGLAIELKTEDGNLKPEQKEFLFNLTTRGWKAIVCYGYDEAIKEIKEYYKDK